MAEVIKVADLTINADKLLKEMQTTKKSINELKVSQKELKDAGDTSSQNFIKQEAKLKSLNTQYRSQVKTLQQVTGVTDSLNAEMKKEAQSLAEAASQNKKLRQARENLNLTTDEGKKALEQINNKIDKNTDFMKENQDAHIQNKMNVGNYTESIREALGINQAYTQAMGIMTTIQGGYNTVVGKSTGAMKLFKIALASTGIGLIVIALGSLVTYLTSTQEGIDKVNRVLKPMQEIFGTLIGQVQELGGAFFKLLSGDFKGFISDVKEIGNTIADDLGEAVERGKDLARIQENLNKSEAEYIKQQGELRREFEEQKRLSDDTTKSTAERQAAAQRAIEIQDEIRKGTEDRLRQEAELLRLKQQSNDTSDAEKAELQRKLTEIDKAFEEQAAKSTEAQNKLNAIVKEGYAKQKEARDKALQDKITSMEEELEYYEETQRLKVDTDEKQLAHLKEVANREGEILKTKLDNKLISETEYETKKLALQNDIQEKEAEMREAELARIEEFDARKKALEEELYLQGLEGQNERELAQLELQQEKEEAELERLQVSEEKKQQLRMLLQQKHLNELSAYEEKKETERLKTQKELAAEELQVREALANAKLGIAGNLSNLMSAIASDDANVQKALLLFEKGVAAGRVIVQTQIANAKAVAASPLTGGLPWTAINTTNMVISLATIAAQTVGGIMKINKQSRGRNSSGSGRSFGRGGLLQGASHANGGIPTEYGELEGEEAVINKRSTAKYGGLLSAINMAEGGRPIMGGNQAPNGLINYDLLADKVAQANRSLPSPRIGVDEITKTSNRVTQIQERAKF